MKKILALIFIFILSFTACLEYNAGSIENNNQQSEKTTVETNTESDKQSELNKTIKFDNFEITISPNVEIFEHRGKDTIKIPISVKNIKSETHTLYSFLIACFDPNGVETENVSLFLDDRVKSDKIRGGATANYSLYFLYNGDGDYFIEFGGHGRNKVDVKIPITKEVTP
jgi:YbbR domain-containing protein